LIKNWNIYLQLKYFEMKSKFVMLTFFSSLIVLAGFGQTSGYFTDERDGYSYDYVTIGEQVWLTENVKFISESGSYVYSAMWDKDTVQNEKNYGRLYDFETALEICPEGWHLPSDKEWGILIEYLGGEDDAGRKLKSKGTSLWQSPNNGATNESGFSAVPGGHKNSSGNCTAHKMYAIFWTSTKKGTYHIGGIELSYQYPNVRLKKVNFENAHSVRCVKNEK
jgi:uncharacterized protein (TIGR02145 family)